jgi:hypothetical protein
VNISFHHLVAKEYREARSWYNKRSRRTALRFMDAVDKGLEQIAAHPELWPSTTSDTSGSSCESSLTFSYIAD